MPKKSIIAIWLALFTPIPAYAQESQVSLTALELAARNGHTESVELLKNDGAKE